MPLPHVQSGSAANDHSRDGRPQSPRAKEARRIILPGYVGRYVVRSRRPRERPDRLRWVRLPLFRRHGEQVLVATERTLMPRSRAGKLLVGMRRAW